MVNSRLYDERSFTSPDERRAHLLAEQNELLSTGKRAPRLTQERMTQLGARLCDHAVNQQRERTAKLLAKLEKDMSAKRKVLDKDTMAQSADRLSMRGAKKHWTLTVPPPLKKRPLSGDRLEEVVKVVYDEPLKRQLQEQDRLRAKYNPPRQNAKISKERAGEVANRLWGHQKELADKKREMAYRTVEENSARTLKLPDAALQESGSRLAVPLDRWLRK